MKTTATTSFSPSLDLTEGVRDPRHYLREVEGLRGLAILLVFLFHAWGISGLQWPQQPVPGLGFIAAGNTGVTLFFVLSGFLLSLPWLRYWRQPDQRKPSLLHYLQARAMRILPLYYFALMVTWLATGNTDTVARAAAFQFVGFGAFPFSVVWWTLVTEVQFYLLLPLMMSLWVSGPRGRWVGTALLLAWAWAYLSLVLHADVGTLDESFFFTKSLFARLPAFLLGIVAAVVYLRAKSWQCVNRQPAVWRYCGLLLMLAVLLLLERVLTRVATMGDRQAELQWHLHHSWEAALWVLMMLCLLLFRLPGARLLVNPALAITGKLSYSLYLIHVPVLFYLIYPVRERLGVDQFQNSWWLYSIGACALLVSLLLSWVSYSLVEKPFLRMKRQLTTGASHPTGSGHG